MTQFVALLFLACLILGLFAFLCRGIKDIPDSERSMGDGYFSPWFRRKGWRPGDPGEPPNLDGRNKARSEITEEA